MTTTRLPTPRTGALVYEQTMRLGNEESSAYFTFENIGRMAVFALRFPHRTGPSPSKPRCRRRFWTSHEAGGACCVGLTAG